MHIGCRLTHGLGLTPFSANHTNPPIDVSGGVKFVEIDRFENYQPALVFLWEWRGERLW